MKDIIFRKFRGLGPPDRQVPRRPWCIHILYTPFPLLYDYDFEWKTKNYRKYGSHVAQGTVYTHLVYTVRYRKSSNFTYKAKFGPF